MTNGVQGLTGVRRIPQSCSADTMPPVSLIIPEKIMNYLILLFFLFIFFYHVYIALGHIEMKDKRTHTRGLDETGRGAGWKFFLAVRLYYYRRRRHHLRLERLGEYII